MTNKTWIGNQDHNNNASNPDNWNPRGVPRPGDSLVINSGTIINLAANVTLPLSNNLTAAAFVASLAHGSSANSQPASVILAGLHATSFDLKNNMLRLLDGDTVVDTLQLSAMSFGPVSVAQNGPNIVLDFGTTAPGTVLPQHV